MPVTTVHASFHNLILIVLTGYSSLTLTASSSTAMTRLLPIPMFRLPSILLIKQIQWLPIKHQILVSDAIRRLPAGIICVF